MSEQFDVAIIGAGPAGLAAAANAAHHKMRHILIEKGEIGNTIFDYQLGKLVMAEPTRLPLRGQVEFAQGSREEVLAAWNKALTEFTINHRRAEVKRIIKESNGFTIQCGDWSCQASKVVLAIGVQGSPRKLGAPGDDLPHIVYTLADPGAHNDKDVVVVGAGDAAIENALGLMDRNRVSLINRGPEFPRAKEANIQKITAAAKQGKISVYFNTTVAKVDKETMLLNTSDGETEIAAQMIIARLGCILPRKFLEDCGITFPSSDANAVPLVSSTYESNIPGLFVLGALIGYPLIKQCMNQGYEVIEHILGNPCEPADQVLVKEALAALPGDVPETLAMIRQNLPFFSSLTDAQFRELIIDSKILSPKKGKVLFEHNDYTDTFWSVVRGEALVDVPGRAPIPIVAGNFFGEAGLLSGRRRTATVRAGKDCILLESPRKQILKLNNSAPVFKKLLDEAFIKRILQSAIFPEAAPQFIDALVSKATSARFKKGEILFKEGDPGEKLFIIRKGSVKVSRKNRHGKDIAQTYIPAGHYVGEMALLSEGPGVRSATVSAAVPVEAIVVDKQSFNELLANSAETKDRIAHLVRTREIQNITHGQDERVGSLLDFVMSEGVTDADNILLIDSDLCVGCDNCESACAATHGGYSRLDRKGGKTLASLQIPISCRHCENPLCMLDCPPDALTRLPNGEVVIRDSCIGCGNCVRNCPYGVIQLIHPPLGGFSLLRMLGLRRPEEGPAKAAKCDQCASLPGGPACVRSCPTGAAVRMHPKDMLTKIEKKRNQGVAL